MTQGADITAQQLAELRDAIDRSFDAEELRMLCLDLGVDSDNLRGEGKRAKAQELVEYFNRREQIPNLIEACRRQRQNVRWDTILEVPSGTTGQVNPLERSRRRRPFKRGLNSFQVEDASIFFGRDKEREALVARISEDRLVIVRGLSGCGKTSLLKAGVISRLRELGYPVVYVSVQEQVTQDILREVNSRLTVREAKFDDALERLHRLKPDCPVILIVDQFENASRSVDDFETFLRDISRLLQAEEQILKVVLAERDDWHTILETAVKNRQLHLDVSLTFKVEFLAKDAAREAIEAPLKNAGIPYDQHVVEDILDRLLEHGYEAPILKSIQPAQLQIVIDLLCSIAEQDGTMDQAFTQETYRRAGGVEGILNQYLAQTLKSRKDVWRLLARFVEGDGQGKLRSHTELTSVPAGKTVEIELQYLIDKGLLQAHAGEEATYYSLAHDYLVKSIVRYLGEHPEDQSLQLAANWLAAGVDEYKHHDLLLERDRYLRIYQHRDELNLTDDSCRLLVLTALHYGDSSIGYWLSRNTNREADLQIVTEKLLASEPGMQKAARQSLAGCVKPRRDTVTPLGEEARRILHSRLQQTSQSSKSAANREAIAEALWTLGIFDSPVQRLQVTTTVFRHWARDHTLQLVGYAVPVLLVIAVVLGLYVREKLRGSWELAQYLKAGPTPLVVADPIDPEMIYAVTQGGPGPREGNSLFVKQGKDWELHSRDFARAPATSLSVVKDGAASRLYATLYSLGVMKSDDQGKTWKLINTGLPSHGLTSLVADPDSPLTLYVGTNDWRGVLRSTNGGESWEFFDYRKEIFGAVITKLAFTRANGGAVVAGTNDGRILIHRRESSDWELVFGLPRGSIDALVTAKSDDKFLYAGTSRGIVIQSSDGGNTWQPWGQISNQFNIGAIATTPDDPQQLYVSAFGNGGYTIWKSVDGGQQWQPISGVGLPRVGISSLEVTGRQPYRILAGTADGLFVSEGDGNSWNQESLTAPLASVHKLAVGASSSAPVYAVVGGSVYSNLTGDLKTWLHGKGLRAEVVRTLAVDMHDPRVTFAGVLLLGEWSVFRTRDGGLTWELTTPPNIESVVPDTTALALSRTSDGKRILYAGATGCGVFVTVDDGDTWDTLGRNKCSEIAGKNYPSDVSALAIDAGNSDTVYAAAGSNFYFSTNGGHDWENQNPPINRPIIGMIADSRGAGNVYLVAGSAGFWRRESADKEWTQLGAKEFSGAELTAIAAIPEQAGRLVVGASNGSVWMTTDEGKTWRYIRENLAVSSITSIAVRSLTGEILVGSLDDGMALFKPGSLFGRDH